MKVRKSPNFDDRTSAGIKYLIMHYTGMHSGKEALDRLCSAEAKVSAHYLIEENGDVYAMVDEEKRAWHAGVSKWEEDIGLNDRSIGIEIVNPGHPYPGYESVYRPFPEKQMEALIKLSKEILSRHNIKPCHVLGHSDIAWQRKIDPGELFDWARLAKEGIGIWPDINPEKSCDVYSMDQFLTKLAEFGYGIEDSIEKLIVAFQRHYRPSKLDGIIDQECCLILDELIRLKSVDNRF
ncbi:N-acetylmuramoyl-L-alanine amidase [Pseudemcibacter aquimaris]|uniref:N-acetylmuramoyl-L-alanine amidase n=1 Tax=Pseudemcibacter aquimaris TaxID=2857064 RepID=UPI002011ACE0|nr:N-acetylmuramoyl-L-alanine amidase [Pseudemcibacter aquimaris]MCC3861382.1 N-acetylmuramoyl-L-alanine amidase [Pseudemcibacter aquimaris]WDU58152.1 N-acetylmuramoyl-L-alanine amidase [Pseudemcibacter aquimaris]